MSDRVLNDVQVALVISNLGIRGYHIMLSIKEAKIADQEGKNSNQKCFEQLIYELNERWEINSVLGPNVTFI